MKWTLINPSGTNDPETGDIYGGLDRFGRVKDNRWLDGEGADLDRIQYGYGRAGNRLWRHNVVAASLSQEFDELYGYDAIHRLNDMARGTLNGPKTALTSSTFGQCWTLDATGNWQGFREDDTGDGTWDLVQSRTANPVNEITAISETTGPSWVTPAYSAAGNMTTLPQPNDPTQGYTATYDAWNRLVKVEDGEETVSEYAYDGAKRRIVQKSYEAGVLDETQHLYYTDSSQWQVIEERVGESDSAERQFVWGLRYIDDLVLRDRDTDTNGTLDERVYSCQDGNWNVTALVGSMGAVQERFAYTAYGVPLALSPSFIPQPRAYDWETLYCGYRWELPTGLYHVRNRVYQPGLGVWVQRDPVGYIDGFNLHYPAFTLNSVDPTGLSTLRCECNRFIYSGGGPTSSGSLVSFTVDTPCDNLGDHCCHQACEANNGAFVGPGRWTIVGANLDMDATSLCDRAPFTSMTGMDCYACCVASYGVPLKVVGPTFVVAGRIPKGMVQPGQYGTKNIWTSLCTRYSPSKNLTKTVRIGSKVGFWTVLFEGGIDCCVLAYCATACRW